MACYLDCELLDPRKETREADPEEARDDSRSYKREEQKKKCGRTKQPPFYILCACVQSWLPSQINHEDIIHNIKPIQQYKLYTAL